MHPLFLLGVAAAGTYAIAKAAPAAPTTPPVAPEITKAATGLARGRMARGASPEQAAAWAADRIARNGGGFWEATSRRKEAARF